ncbi:O-antigen ligase [Thioalkalivibrio sp. ALE23]|uniref:O-antigen ligase family protein n=1 Tax=Thioalkalivibrio sp. ALE23 TaxID=1265495 RepID=UPI001E2DF1ED|nr:O-antigen ligase family protein [Thioalkalivibrio sp. ALE23]
MADVEARRYRSFHGVGIVVGFLGVYLFAVSQAWSTTLVDVGLFLVVVGSLFLLPRIWSDIKCEPVFWLAVGITGYILLHSLVYLQFAPALDDSINPNWNHWLRVGGLWSVLLGWWLWCFPGHLKPFLVTLVVGLFFGAGVDGDVGALLDGDIWDRSVWGYSPNYLGMFSSMLMLGLLSWVLYERKGRLRGWEWILGAGVFLGLVMMLYTSGSRTAWLAFPAGFGILLLYGLLSRAVGGMNKATIFLSGLALVILAAVVFSNMEYFVERFSREWEALQAFLYLDWSTSAEIGGSFGSRVAMWLVGLEAILDRPVFGWGGGSGSMILNPAGLDYGHFHNIYLEILTSFGVVGGALFLAFHVLLYAGVVRSYFRAVISPALFVGLLSATVVLLIMLMNEIRIGQSEGRALITSLYALYFYSLFRLKSR